MDRMISISETARIIGVTTRTLKRWDKKGVLKVYRTLGNHSNLFFRKTLRCKRRKKNKENS